MAPDGRWYCQTIFGPPDVARVMQLLEDGERLRVVARRRDVSPNIVSGVRRSYQENGEYINRQGQSCSRMITPIKYCFLVLLSHRNHMSTDRALEIDFSCANEVQLPHQIVR